MAILNNINVLDVIVKNKKMACQKLLNCNVKLHKNRERIAMRFIKKAGTQTIYLFSSHVYKQD